MVEDFDSIGSGEIKQESISSVNQEIGEFLEDQEDKGFIKHQKDEPEPFDILKFMGAAGEADCPNIAFIMNSKPYEITACQAGRLIASLQWSMNNIKERWDDLSWEDAAIVTVMENQIMNLKLQQKQIKK